jgi:hypothetical protein
VDFLRLFFQVKNLEVFGLRVLLLQGNWVIKIPVQNVGNAIRCQTRFTLFYFFGELIVTMCLAFELFNIQIMILVRLAIRLTFIIISIFFASIYIAKKDTFMA